MLRRPTRARATARVLLCAVSLAVAARAAPPDKAACAAAYEDGQRLQRKNALRRAREQLLVCARDPCPKVLQPDCLEWLARVEQALPSLVVVARGPEGQAVKGVKMFLDGELVAAKLEGRAIDVDPGEHTLRLEPEGAPAVVQSVLVNEAEKARTLVVSVEARDPPPEAPAPRASSSDGVTSASAASPSWPAYALAALGGVGLLGFAYFGVSGVSARSDLASCRGGCDPSAVDAVSRKLVIADVSLGVSIVALGVAAYLFLSGGHRAAARAPSP